MEAFSTSEVNKDTLDLDGLKCEQKGVYAVRFCKVKVKHLRSCTHYRGLEQNQALAQATKFRRLIQTIAAIFAFCETSSSLKHVNNYMRCSRSEGRLNKLVFISMNKDLLKKKMMVWMDSLFNGISTF